MPKSSTFWLVLAALLGSSSPALAFERQWHVGAGGGVVLPPGEYSVGPALAAHGASVLSGAAGIAYKLDIIEWVPYGGVLAGYTWSDPDLPSELGPHRSPTLGFILGVDYGFSRNFGVGVAFREDFLLSGGGMQGAFLL